MKQRFQYLFVIVLIIQGMALSAGSGKMNVLFIAVDDLKPVLSCYGASQIVSPNINLLARQGVMFQKAYCQWAVCGPTRASLLTGMTPDGSGVQNLTTQLREYNPDVVTMPQYFI